MHTFHGHFKQGIIYNVKIPGVSSRDGNAADDGVVVCKTVKSPPPADASICFISNRDYNCLIYIRTGIRHTIISLCRNLKLQNCHRNAKDETRSS